MAKPARLQANRSVEVDAQLRPCTSRTGAVVRHSPSTLASSYAKHVRIPLHRMSLCWSQASLAPTAAHSIHPSVHGEQWKFGSPHLPSAG